MTSNAKIFSAIIILAAVAITMLFLLKRKTNEEIIDGGEPCRYDTLTVPAKVVRIDFYDSTNADILLEIKAKNDFVDTIYFSRQYPYKSLKTPDVKSSGIIEGDTLKCTCYKINSGSCNPYIYIPSMEKF